MKKKPGPPKGVRHAGRKKGSLNKKTLYMQRLKDSGFDPFEIVKMIANGEVKETKVIGRNKETGAPIAVQVELPWELRLKAALELCSYIEPKARGHLPVDPDEHDHNVAETGRIAQGLRELEVILAAGRGAAGEADPDPSNGTGETVN